MFVIGVEKVLEDDGFQIPSPLAVAARETATTVLAWCRDPGNEQALSTFSSQLVSKLQVAVSQQARKLQTQREKMWGMYHSIRSSDDFRTSWEKFLHESPGCEACPIFYQYVTDKVFKRLIFMYFPVAQSEHHTDTTMDNLSYEEANALRYTAGYVCRSVRKKIGGCDELKLCLEELLLDDDAEDITECSSTDWINICDRGGLTRVNDEAFAVFVAIEQVFRQHFHKDKASIVFTGSRKELCATIVRNEDVLFYWCIAAADMDEENSTTLLQMIVESWVTIRGFSFAGAWVELYKQRTKKTLKRSKGIRKALFTSKTE